MAADTLGAALAAAGQPLLALDLRRLPEHGEAGRWLQNPQGTWSITLHFDPADPEQELEVEPVGEHSDELLFVARTTPSRLWEP